MLSAILVRKGFLGQQNRNPSIHCIEGLRFQIIFIKKRRTKKFLQAYSKSLTHFMDDTKLYRIV